MVDLDHSMDVEILDLTCKFKKFLMNNKARTGDVWGGAKKARFQDLKFLDKSGRHISVCPLCYEAGHKRKDCPEKEDEPIRRCFKCNGIGHFKIDCPSGKLKGDALKRWKVSNECVVVEGSKNMVFQMQ